MWRELTGPGAAPDLPPSRHDPEQVRQAADEILSRPDYQWEEPSDNALEEVAEWIAERLSDLFPGGDGGAAGGGGGGGSLALVIAYVFLALLVALVAFLVYRAAAHGLRPDRRRRRSASEVVVEAGEEGHDWEAEAAAHEARGEWREGLRCRYRALVATLADREVIPDLVGRTAGELVSDVRRSCPPASRAFGAATGAFEEAFYGGAAGGPADRDRFATLAREVLEQAPGPVERDRPGPERELVAPS